MNGAPPSLHDVCVVVLSHNRRVELRSNLERLADEAVGTGLQVVLVDNASSDGSSEICAEFADRNMGWTAVLLGENTGVAGGRNAGLWNSDRRYTLNVDDDTRIGVKAVAELRDNLARHPNVAAVSPLIRHPGSGELQNDPSRAAFGVSNYHGACHMFRTQVIRSIGGIDELCNFGGEELDTSVRLRHLGYDVAVDLSITVEHNSLLRPPQEDAYRRLRRSWNFPRIIATHFPLRVSFVASLKYSLAHVKSGLPHHGLSFAVLVIRRSISGFLQGRGRFSEVRREVTSQYFPSKRVGRA